MKKMILLSVVGALLLGTPWMSGALASCGSCGEKSACGEKAPCATPCQTACKPCEVKCCEKRKISYCENKTSWKLVKNTCCVPKTKMVCKKDPCDPCNVQRVAVTTYHNHTSYQWVKNVTPVWKEKTIKVCTRRTIQNGETVQEASAAQLMPSAG